MLTNIFRLGFRQISWFQLIAADVDSPLSSERWFCDQATKKVLNAHIKLQNEGHLSAWTPSDNVGSHGEFVVKLWVFIPGRSEAITMALQTMLVGLKVVASGQCIFSKDKNEVTSAFCEALQNRIERGLRSVGYMRFGDVFVKCRAFDAHESQLRKPLPACEVAFAANEDAIFMHIVLQRKRVRALSTDDIQAASKAKHDGFGEHNLLQQVIVAPHGMRGKLIGSYPSDLIRTLYESRVKGDDNKEASLYNVSSWYNGINSTYGFHAEVSFGSETMESSRKRQSTRGLHMSQQEAGRTPSEKEDGSSMKSIHPIQWTLLYPAEAAVVPLGPALPAKVFLKRCGRADLSLLGNSNTPIANPSSKSSSSSMSSSGGSSVQNSSSHGSSTSDSDGGDTGLAPGELDADAESLVVKRKQTQVPSRPILDVERKGYEEVAALVKWGQSGATATQGDAAILKAAKRSSSSGGEISNDGYRSLQNRTDAGVSGMVLSPNVGLGTPKAASSQVGTPWNWPEDDRGLNMGIENDADILAEFGDFGDFFEDDGLGFGEPPGTAESQAMMFDCIDGIGSPVNGCDISDPMLLPILDIPVLEGLDQDLPAPVAMDSKPLALVSTSQEMQDGEKTPDMPPEVHNPALDLLPKEEAVLLLAPGYEPVSFPSARDASYLGFFKLPYIPRVRKAQLEMTRGSERYVYGADPPPSPKTPNQERKGEHYEMVSDRALLNGKRFKNGATPAKSAREKSNFSAVGRLSADKTSLLGKKAPSKEAATWAGSSAYVHGPNLIVPKLFINPMLATEITCILLQLTFLQLKDTFQIKGLALSSASMQELDSAFLTESGAFPAKVFPNQQEKKKKDRIPSRIAGDLDEEVPSDGPCVSQIGVWRPVGTPKPPQRPPHATWTEANMQTSSGVTSIEPGGAATNHESVSSLSKLNHHWQELLDTLPLLIQQGSVSFDLALDGENADGPFGWLSTQEQKMQRYVCGPGTVHAGCGGMLSASHHLDNAGVELLDSLTSEISAASVATILQSDMRVAMATAFGDARLDGPLSLGEWLRGRAFDTFATDVDSKEVASTVLVGMGEPITPPQCTTGPVSMKADIESQACDTHRSTSSWAMEGSSLSEDGCMRRSGQEAGLVDTDSLPSGGLGGPTAMAIPFPSLLVGYQDDWLKVSSSTLHLWEKAPLEPYATAKPVTYYVVCPRIGPLLSAAADYLQQLSCVYEACMLGTHVAGNMVFSQSGFPPLSNANGSFSGFVAMDFPPQGSPSQGQVNTLCPLNNYVTNFGKFWNPQEFLKALSKACKALPVSTGNAAQREHENGPFLAYYIICPSSDPEVVLQTMLIACQSIGHNIAVSDRQRRASMVGQIQHASVGSILVEDPAHCIVGFSVPKLVLQVLTAENIFKPHSPISVDADLLKEVAFCVYNKIRRMPYAYNSSDLIVHNAHPSRGRTPPLQSSIPMSSTGIWKDCGPGRSSGTSATSGCGHDALLDSSVFRSNTWDNSWQQQVVGNEISSVDFGQQLNDSFKYLFEPLFILAEPGSLENGIGVSSSHSTGSDEASRSLHLGPSEAALGTLADSGSDFDVMGGGIQKLANLHCCYGWTDDWQWLVSVWTDARGELLDVHLFPVSGGSGRGDKSLHGLFSQVLLHGCQFLSMGSGTGSLKQRGMVIARIGPFFELECQEWQKAVFMVGGLEVKRWPLQIWQQQLEGTGVVGNSNSLQPQDTSTLAERSMVLAGGMPSSPGPSSSVFISRTKPSNYVKMDMGGSGTRKPVGSGAHGGGQNDVCKGAFHLLQSISFVSVVLDHMLQIVGPNDVGSQAAATSGGSQSTVSSSWLNSSSTNVLNALGSGVGPVKTLASTSVSYILVPAHGARFISHIPRQPTPCPACDLPITEQLLRKSGSATTVALAFVVSRSSPSVRTELANSKSTEEWPSTLCVGLVGHLSSSFGFNSQQYGVGGGTSATLGNDTLLKAKLAKLPMHVDGGFDQSSEAHAVVEAIAAELQSLSWLTVSPTAPLRRSALPFHCDIMQRLRRLLQYAVNQVDGLQDL